MKRKLWEIGPEMEITGKFGALQEHLTDEEIELTEMRRERVEVKEGRCEECGVFDVLSRTEDKFICPECIRLFSKATRKSRKR
jgi:hypothetical protein